MFASQHVTYSFLDRVIADYQELYQSFDLHPSEQTQGMRKFVRQKLETIPALKASLGTKTLDPQVQRTLKLELRSAQRTWTRHLVTTARLNRQRKARPDSYLSPVVAA